MAPKTVAPPPPPAPVATAVAPPPPPAPAAQAAAPTDFDFDDAMPIPAGRSFGGGQGESSQTAAKLNAQPVDKSFLEIVTVAAEITDPKERQKEFNAECKRIVNRIGGAIRRIRKTNPERNYAIRKVASPELGYGVRVWRTADSATTA